MVTKFIGRKEEKAILREAFESEEAEMVAVIGRRRVGKTFLIRSVFEDTFDFEITGIQHATEEEQLKNFRIHLDKTMSAKIPSQTPSDWLDAFNFLIQYLESLEKKEKLVLFFDELPWLAAQRSGFLKGLGFFWNSWAYKQNILVVICGSAASWMIQKVVNHKGGLHNRITKMIFLKPFDLTETEEYLQSRKMNLNRYHILQLYMAMGGIPHYLKEIKRGESATQNIDRICFAENGLLRDEFSRLYPALFEHSENHVEIVRALATKNKGMRREEIIQSTRLSNGGGLTKTLEELTQSGFISKYYPFGKKKKDLLYRLTDEYSLFYLRFIEDKVHEEKEVWQKLSQTQIYKSWAGYAFESICMKNIPKIKQALGISGIYTQSASFFAKPTEYETGAQIDLVIDRSDQVINLFEIKFYNDEFIITKEFNKALRNKWGVFERTTKSKKQIFFVMITTFGLKANPHRDDVVVKSLTLEDLF